MKLLKAFLIRLLIFAVPLLLLYIFAEISFEANRQKEHRTDTGLGIAIILAMTLIFLSCGFVADLIFRLVKKDYKTALINLPFLLPSVFVITYISCLMSGGDGFCGWLIEVIK